MLARTSVRLALYCVLGAGLSAVVSHGIGDAAAGSPATSAEAPAAVPDAQVGIASWYGADQQGKLTASGRPFDRRKLTAAHPSLPLNSKAKVTNLDNGRSVEVTINDRGPGAPGRDIDVSQKAAQKLGMKKEGLAPVVIEPVGKDGETPSSAKTEGTERDRQP